MNPTMTAAYLGSLRCEATHLRSGQKIITDAPVDNKGRGEAFSPSDLLCASLANCMMTIMGISAQEKSIPLTQVSADIVKIMGTDPRRVIGIQISFKIESAGLTEKDRAILTHAALTCPVAKSIHPDINQDITFEFNH